MEPDLAERMHHLLYARHSARAPFDPTWHVTARELSHLVEAARWAPTPHDMQNFELVVVEDPVVLGELGKISCEARLLRDLIAGAPMVIVVIFDPTTRAPASNHDELGMMGLGGILENMWLISQALQLDLQVVSSFAAPKIEPEVARVLGIPQPYRIAFALRIGHATEPPASPRVRRDAPRFVHRDHFTK